MAPIPLGVEITEKQAVLKFELDTSKRPGNLTGNKGFPADRGLMVEQDTVACIHTVGFTVVDGNPVRIQLGNRIRTTRIEWGGFPLRDLLH
ncbi:hypothetical protein D9M71_770930 [compost metagenome]